MMQRTKWSCEASRRERRARSWWRNAETTVALLLLLLLLLPAGFDDPAFDPVAASATSLRSGSVENLESSASASAETTSLFFDRKPLVAYETVPAACATEKEAPAPAGQPATTAAEAAK